MSKAPSRSQALALKAAALANQDQDETEFVATPEVKVAAFIKQPVEEEPVQGPSRGGRPKGRRQVAARQTIYLDQKRHAALARIAEDRGRSVHSLIIEGIDHVIGKPVKPGWE